MARKKKDLESMEFEGDEPELAAMDEQVEPEVEPEDPSDIRQHPSYDPGPEAPEPDDTPAPEPPAAPEGDAPDFPLEEGHYFYTPVLSSRGHSEGPGVALLREHLGLSDSEEFDGNLLVAVQSFQKDLGEPMSGVVDAALWQEIFSR